ncbi:MAG TPA: flagellar export chaperone FliS [Terracidiphilus sp.]|jgi:flagellar protein FliS|nr:flagellar export chaperone FliS [Terracidiphilus sp.]
MSLYQEQALKGASPIDLVVALYDGMIRFLHGAADAVDRGDINARRAQVKRALDILVHLQARLRMDVGGQPALVLSEFYASIFAQILQASRAASRSKFEHTIGCVRNVRDAWKQVAREFNETGIFQEGSFPPRPRSAPDQLQAGPTTSEVGHWTA